jgi:hypothetical protein
VVVVGAAVLAVLLSGAVGCSSHKKEKTAKKDETFHPDFFPPESEQRQVDRFVEVQAAEGAKDDAMLFASHFDGNELNTAGQVKLNLMLRNQSSRQPWWLPESAGERPDDGGASYGGRAAREGFGNGRGEPRSERGRQPRHADQRQYEPAQPAQDRQRLQGRRREVLAERDRYKQHERRFEPAVDVAAFKQ